MRESVMSVQASAVAMSISVWHIKLNTVVTRTAVINFSESFLIHLFKCDNNLEIHK